MQALKGTSVSSPHPIHRRWGKKRVERCAVCSVLSSGHDRSQHSQATLMLLLSICWRCLSSQTFLSFLWCVRCVGVHSPFCLPEAPQSQVCNPISQCSATPAVFMPHLCQAVWRPAFPMPRPFNTAPHVVGTPNHKITSLLLHNCKFASGLNHDVNIWYAGYLICNPFAVKRSWLWGYKPLFYRHAFKSSSLEAAAGESLWV